MLANPACPSTPLPRDLAGSPAILRLKLLEMNIAAKGRLPEDSRQSAHHLIAALRRAIAEKPSLTFADVVAKLKTCDEMSQDSIGEKIGDMQKALLKSAIADLARINP